jgi:hypothetical protein
MEIDRERFNQLKNDLDSCSIDQLQAIIEESVMLIIEMGK